MKDAETFAHADQPEAGPAPGAGHLEALARVFDREVNAIRRAVDMYLRRTGLTVFRDVGQAFLGDTE
jgi:hypothetical protein